MAGNISAHTGDIFLASLYAYDDSQVDDWAISPLLDGSAQTVSFWARSLDGEYPEKIEVSWSSGSLTPADFTTVLTVNTVASQWTKYEAKLPSGAKRFAVRSCAKGAFMLMLDDFTYRQGAVFSDYVVKGYNVYRDGKKINTEVIKTTTFTDKDGSIDIDAAHSYIVTAVYTHSEGEFESGPSNEASVAAGVDDISVDSSRPVISTSPNRLTVSNAQGLDVTVYSIDGHIAAKATGNAEFNTYQGVYLVKAGRYTFKVYVP